MSGGDVIRIEGLRAEGVVGLHAPERSAAQAIMIDATLTVDLAAMALSDDVADGVNYKTVAQEMVSHASGAERHTLEALASDLAGVCLHHRGVSLVSITLWKPGQDAYAERVSVGVERTRAQALTRAFVVIGSNHDAETNLGLAVERLGVIGAIVRVSPVYETADVGGTGGGVYLNAGAIVETCLPSFAVRRALKSIEREMGRDEGASGEVPIDLDLCLHGGSIVRTCGVDVPRREILERGYVARVLADLDGSFAHPETGETLEAIANRLGGADGARVRTDVALREKA